MSISFKPVGDHLEISFPFAIKDQFREIFKTAQWNPTKKIWFVTNNKINLNKIEYFKEKTVAAIVMIEKLEESELTQKEIQKFEESIEALQLSLKKNIDTQPDLDSELLILNNLKEKYKDLSDKTLKAQADRNAAKTAIHEHIRSLMSPHETEHQIAELIRFRKMRVTSENRQKFESVQARLKQIFNEIKRTSGVEIHTLDNLAYLNWNRPDRDNPAETAKSLYTDISYEECVTE